MKKISVSVAGKSLVINLDATAFVKWENRAKAVNLNVAALLSLFLTAEVQRT